MGNRALLQEGKMFKSNAENAQDALDSLVKLSALPAQVKAGRKKLMVFLVLSAFFIVSSWFYGIKYVDFLVEIPLFSKIMLLVAPMCLLMIIGLYLQRRFSDFLHQQQVLLLLHHQTAPLEEIGDNLTQIIETAKSVEQKISKTADGSQVDQQVSKQMEALKEEISAILENFSQQKQEFHKKLEKISKTRENSLNAYHDLTQEQDQTDRDAFLKSAQFVLQDLHATSMDIVRDLEGSINENDWKRFTKGDRGFFTRRLLKHPLDQLARELELRMINNTDLQNFVYRFVQEFERLLGSTDELDPEGVLYALLISSDIGKLALLLKKAQGK